MANVSKEALAGPEWAYCAPLARKNSIKVDFDSLYVNIQREGADAVIDSFQVLSEQQQGTYMPSSVLRFSFDRLRSLIGSQGGNFDLFFEAFDAGGDVLIPDSQSFRRLLVAIGHLGVPLPSEGNPNSDFPPVLRFLAKPKAAAVPARANVPRPDQGQAPRTPGPRNIVPTRPNTPTGARTKPPASSRPVSTAGPSGPSTPQSARAEPGKRSSLAIPPQVNVDDETGENSFLEQPVEKELTFEDRIDEDLGYGLSDQKENHNERVHNLYADIAGISRDMRNPEDPLHEYSPPYSSISLPPHQSYPTGWLLDDSSRILHYLCDKPGLGKTFAACEAMVRLTMILSNGVAIEDERANLSNMRDRPLHMHNTAHEKWGRNDSCRAETVSKYGFVCSCDPNSPLHAITRAGNFSEGYMMVIVPLHLNDQWVREMTRFIRSTTRLPHNQKPFEIVNIHGVKGSPGDALKDFVFGKRENHGLGTICIVPATTTVLTSLRAIRGMSDGQNLTQQPSIIVCDEVQRIRTVDHNTVEFVQELIDLASYPVHVLALSGTPLTTGPSDFKVVETIALSERSFRGWYGDEVYNGYKDRLTDARENLEEYAKRVRHSGIIARGQKGELPDDEKQGAHGLMRSYDESCREYAAELPLLQRKEWGDYLGYRIPKSQPESAPTEIITCNSVMNDLQKAVAKDYKEYLRVRYVHRLRVWSRKPEATRGPRPKMSEILFDLDAKPSSASLRSNIDASLIGFAPGLARRVLKRKDNQFRSEEANEIFRKTTTSSQRMAVANSPYWDMAVLAFQKVNQETGESEVHPKIKAICKIIDEMLADQEEHRNGPPKRFGVLQKKAVICVPHAWQGYILTAFLFKHYPTRNFTYVPAGMLQEDKDRLIAPFQRRTDVRDPADGRSDDPIALIGTYNIIGTGLNLTRANYAIATSPLSSKGDQSQLFARIDRKGQFCTTHSYVLMDNGNPVDVTTFHRMQMRTALTVPEEERGGGLEFLLEGADEVENQEIDTSYQSGEEDSEAE